MFDVNVWMTRLTEGLKEAFGPRLLFVGLQGSFGRGEAGPDSDIDVVTVLDTLSVSDLKIYRTLVRSMPSGERACGFLCGAEDLKHWPRYDLAQLEQDTVPIYGSFRELLPPRSREALAEAARNGAAALYHALCHSYLYGKGPDRLAQRCKEAFFVLRALHEWRTGEYVPTRRELVRRLEGTEREILEYTIGTAPSVSPEILMERLLDWVKSVLEEVQNITRLDLPHGGHSNPMDGGAVVENECYWDLFWQTGLPEAWLVSRIEDKPASAAAPEETECGGAPM